MTADARAELGGAIRDMLGLPLALTRWLASDLQDALIDAVARRVARASSPKESAVFVRGRSFAPGRAEALAWREREFQVGVVSSLPRDEHGDVVWDLAGPMMMRELPMAKFAAMYLSGREGQDAELLAKQMINEWHGLERNAGLDGDYGPSDMLEDHDPQTSVEVSRQDDLARVRHRLLELQSEEP